MIMKTENTMKAEITIRHIEMFGKILNEEYTLGRIESARIETPVVLNGLLILLEHVL
jgi:hypothetical protein